MGQQQLLLLVLGIVIVGIAVVAGIQAFSEGKSKSERDAAAGDAMRIVSDIQAWMMKPAAFGGGAGTSDEVNFTKLGYPKAESGETVGVQSNETEYYTMSGCYTVSGQANGVVELTVKLKDPKQSDGSCDETYATVKVSGPKVDDIEWSYGPTGG